MLIHKNHQQLAYYTLDAGFNQTLLMIHSELTNHTLFEKQVEYFKDIVNIITLDLWGHGQSNSKGSLLTIKSTIEEILNLESIKQVHLLGIGLGGSIAQDFANDYPERVLSLMCFSSYDIFNRNQNLQRFLDEHHVRNFLKVDSLSKKLTNNKSASKIYQELVKEFNPKSFLILNQIPRLRGTPPKKKRQYPILIGVGEFEDEGIIYANQFWHNSEPESQYIIMNDSKTLVNLDQPETFNQTVLNFIKGT